MVHVLVKFETKNLPNISAMLSKWMIIFWFESTEAG